MSFTENLLRQSGCVEVKVGTSAFALREAHWKDIKAQILGNIKKFHEVNAAHSGITLEELLASEKGNKKSIGQEFLEKVLASLVEDGLVGTVGGVYKLNSFSAELSEPFKKIWTKVVPLISTTAGKIPVAQDLAEAIGITRSSLDRHLKEAVKVGYLLKISEKRYFLPETILKLREVCISLSDNSVEGRFTVADFRDKAGIGRNAVVEILEFFDREGLTLRKGNYRVLRRK